MQRSLLIFENSLKSEGTRRMYIYHLNRFMKFFEIKSYDDLTNSESSQLQIMVEDYIMHLNKQISPNSLNVPISAIKSFLDCNDIELRWQKIERLVPAKVKRSGAEEWLTEEVDTMLKNTSLLRTKTLLHFLASSGIRVGAFEGM
jgi:site-specific recombinase XerD